MEENRMRRGVVALCLMSFVNLTWAASPGAAPDPPLTTFRVESAEVHVSFAAFDKHKAPVTSLSTDDFTILRDGYPLQQAVILERRQDSAISAAVMTDVSDSMVKAVPMARETWQWMNTNIVRPSDRIAFYDFGNTLSAVEMPQGSGPRVTSLYDCLMRVIPLVVANAAGRRTLILFTDGYDNMSMHSMMDVAKLAAEQNVAIYAIATWKFKLSYDEQVLDFLTSKTGGRFFVVKDSRQMIASVQTIEQELRNGYELVFRADKASTGLHDLTMQATHQRLKFYHRAAYYQPPANEPNLIATAGVR